jgi:hypothetical protein
LTYGAVAMGAVSGWSRYPLHRSNNSLYDREKAGGKRRKIDQLDFCFHDMANALNISNCYLSRLWYFFQGMFLLGMRPRY